MTDEASQRLQEARREAGFATAADAAARHGWTESTYRSHENGIRGFPAKRAEIYARAFRVSPEWLLYGRGSPRKKQVPVVGYIGAGAEVYPFDDGGCLDEVEPPPGIRSEAVAVVVRGESMWPRYTAGDVIIYDEHTPLDRVDGMECVVALEDGRRLVKRVRVDSGTGLATLESHNAPPIEGARLLWAAPIVWVKRA